MRKMWSGTFGNELEEIFFTQERLSYRYCEPEITPAVFATPFTSAVFPDSAPRLCLERRGREVAACVQTGLARSRVN